MPKDLMEMIFCYSRDPETIRRIATIKEMFNIDPSIDFERISIRIDGDGCIVVHAFHK